MNTFYSLEKHKTVVRLLQITDSHLFSSRDDCLLGVNTYDSLHAVLSEIKKSDFAFDAILATGDLIQDHQILGYQHFAEMLKPFAKPVFWLEGNHDTQPQMSLQLAKYPHIHPEKAILAGEKWQILLLNSQVSDSPSGHLSKGQLAWLEQRLTQHRDRFAFIILHHNLLPTQSAWLDPHSLKNVAEFAQRLSPFPQIKGILHGHIHQEMDTIWNGIRVLATPSTCIQFKPHCDEFTLDLRPQGWREITLLPDGQVETQCKRLENNVFLPNIDAKGY